MTDDLTRILNKVVIANIFLEGLWKSSEISVWKASPYLNAKLSKFEGRILPTQLQCLVQAAVTCHNILFKGGRKKIPTTL
jgi:hypothetical protein